MTGEMRTAMRSEGFTLVELLVALTILALMLGVTMNSLSFSLRTSGSVESAIADKESTHLATRAFREQLQRAVPLLRVSTAGQNELDFDGASNAVEFIAPLRGAGSSAGLYRIRFVIEQKASFEGNRGRLVMHYRPYSPNSTNAQAANNTTDSSVVVLEGFAAAHFSFSDVVTAVAVDWTAEWRETMRLPDLVRLQVDYGAEIEQADIPDAVVAIRTTTQNRLLRGEAR